MLKFTEGKFNYYPMTVKDMIKELKQLNPDAIVEIHAVAPTEDCDIHKNYIMIDRDVDTVGYAHNKEYNSSDWNSPLYDTEKVVISSRGLI